MVGDVTGDGRADAVAWFASNRSWWVANSDGQAFRQWGSWKDDFGSTASSSKRWLADLNSDGRADATYYHAASNQIKAALSNGQQFQDEYPWAEPTLANATWNRELLVGDTDGNGQADLIINDDQDKLAVGVSIDTIPPETKIESTTNLRDMSSVEDRAINHLDYFNGSSTGLHQYPNGISDYRFGVLFDFNSERLARFECNLDGAGWGACTRSQLLEGRRYLDGSYTHVSQDRAEWKHLDDGQHTLEVRAVDVAGNTDPTPDSQGFTIDTKAPAVSMGPPLEARWADNNLQAIDDGRVANLNGDQNGDALGDAIAFSTTGQVFARITDPDGGGEWREWFNDSQFRTGDDLPVITRLVGDVDGDDSADIVLVNGATGAWSVALADSGQQRFVLEPEQCPNVVDRRLKSVRRRPSRLSSWDYRRSLVCRP